MSTGRPFAEGTEVSPERSQAEIQKNLQRYGATGFMYGWEEDTAVLAFEAHGRLVRFHLPLPDPNDRAFARTPTGRSRNPQTAYEAEVRRRWRALTLAIKAKLEAVSTGITSFEEEFGMFVVLPDGSTVRDHVLPKIDEAYQNGTVPALLPPTGPAALTAGQPG
jgi:hypothetical protein